MVVVDACSLCGESIHIELNCFERSSRHDAKRPFYLDEELPESLAELCEPSSITVFRCRNCDSPVSDTVPMARYEDLIDD